MMAGKFFVLYAIGKVDDDTPQDVAVTRRDAEARRDALKAHWGGFWHIWLVKLDAASLEKVLWSEYDIHAPIYVLTESEVTQ